MCHLKEVSNRSDRLKIKDFNEAFEKICGFTTSSATWIDVVQAIWSLNFEQKFKLIKFESINCFD